MAAVHDLNVDQGATFTLTTHWKAGQQLVDLTGYTSKMQFRSAPSDDTVLHTSSTENGQITLGANGTISLHIPPGDTSAFSFTKAVYDLIVTAPDGDVFRLFEGHVAVSPEVTR